MPYNFAADSFHTKKLCSRLSSSEVHFLIKIGRFAFLRPPLGDFGATYDDHLRLIGKRVLDFLLVMLISDFPQIRMSNLKIRLSVLTMPLKARERQLCISVLWPSGAVTPATVLVDGGGDGV